VHERNKGSERILTMTGGPGLQVGCSSCFLVGSTVINGSFSKIAVIAVFAVVAANCTNLTNLAICTVIYIVKMANCGKLCKLW
jgi:hypothetical protein